MVNGMNHDSATGEPIGSTEKHRMEQKVAEAFDSLGRIKG